jgi:4,5-DOPA dioxygenase extradiol
MADVMPVIFFGHGNPLNALSKNAFTDGWAAIGRSIPHPQRQSRQTPITPLGLI